MVRKRKKNKPKMIFKNPDMVFREEGKEALLFDPNTGSIKVLNYTGKMIWVLLDGKNSQSDISKKLSRKFSEENPNRISKDLNKFLNELGRLGYLGKEDKKAGDKAAHS